MLLDDSVGYLVNQTGRKLSQLVMQYFKPYGITTEQWTLLYRLSEQDSITQNDLAKRTGKDQTNVTRILDQLERKGFIERKPNAVDRRSYLTCLTSEGKKLCVQLLPIEAQAMLAATEGLSQDEVRLLKNILNKLTDNAVRYIKN